MTGSALQDIYFKPGTLRDRRTFLSDIGLEPDRPLVFLAANAQHLGWHEPDIARFLGERFLVNDAPRSPNLIVRSHPNDTEALERFPSGPVGRYRLEKGRFDDPKHVAELLSHADATISTGGTVSLDAVALGNTAICLNFDGNRTTAPEESIRQENMKEHLSAMFESDAVHLVDDYEALSDAVRNACRGDRPDPQARRRLMEFHVLPFDGKATERTVKEILCVLEEQH